MRSVLIDSFHLFMLKVRRADQWPETEALVYSSTWDDYAGSDSPVGETKVTYSYRVAGDLSTGVAAWTDPHGLNTYRKGDPITVRVDPKRPLRSYCPNKEQVSSGMLFGFIFGFGAFLLFASFVYILNR